MIWLIHVKNRVVSKDSQSCCAPVHTLFAHLGIIRMLRNAIYFYLYNCLLANLMIISLSYLFIL